RLMRDIQQRGSATEGPGVTQCGLCKVGFRYSRRRRFRSRAVLTGMPHDAISKLRLNYCYCDISWRYFQRAWRRLAAMRESQAAPTRAAAGAASGRAVAPEKIAQENAGCQCRATR